MHIAVVLIIFMFRISRAFGGIFLLYIVLNIISLALKNACNLIIQVKMFIEWGCVPDRQFSLEIQW